MLESIDQGALILYALLLLLTILELIIIYYGITSTWYQGLNRTTEPSLYLTIVIWIGAYALSILGYYVLRREIPINDGFFATLFILGTILNIEWAVLLFQHQNIRASIWLMLFIFLYQILLVIVVAYLSPLAGILNIPILLAYAYTLYLLIRLAVLNGITL